MKVEELTKEQELDNERIAMRNTKAKGYTVFTLQGYPDNGKHLGCYTDLPCKIEKGRDEFHNKLRWNVIFDTNINIENKTYSNLNLATNGAILDYKKHLKEELRKIDKGILK